MMASEVYFSDFRVGHYGGPIPEKFKKLLLAAGIDKIDFKNKHVAIKIHFGELGNMAYLRPQYAKVLADIIKEKGGKPFLTDCNTLYVGSRKEAIEHMETAYENGYNPFTTGCHVIIADGLKGLNETLVPIDGEYVKEARIGEAIMEADIFISLSHFKGHEATGFGGAIKNIGMGCGSRAGKMEQHSTGKPSIKEDKCVGCKTCAKQCAQDAISFHEKKASIDKNKCVGCGRCVSACPVDAVKTPEGHSNEILCKKMAEYAYAVVKDRPQFHINVVSDVSPYCDCYYTNDTPMLPNIGMFASFDAVALDMACVDACNAAPAMPDSVLSEAAPACDHIHAANPGTHWQDTLEHAQKLGMGTMEYELKKID
ncbi:MAG: DUF362 domain-containing protein [Parasporobacterium sp.]|nr:DUF362 domain-containing protein [Parasporobacterium sp.]